MPSGLGLRLPSPAPRSRVGLLLWLGTLYFAQGLPFGLQATALPVFLRQSGVSLLAVGSLGILSLPWMLKPLWAPLVDRVGSARWGRRRSWIVPLQAALGAVSAAAAWARLPDQLWLLLAMVLLLNFLAATQDIATDGLAVDLLGERELGAGNALQVVGYKLGMLVGGGLFVWLSSRLGWRASLLMMAGCYWAVLLLTLLQREDPQPRGAAEPERACSGRLEGSWWVELGRLMRQRQTWALVVVVASYKFGEAVSDVLYKPFLVDLGLSAAQIGLWVGSWGLAFSILGSAVGGWLASRFNPLPAVVGCAVVRVLPLAGRALLAQSAGPTQAAIVWVTMTEEVVGGALTTAVFALMMSRVDRRMAATHYALLASVEVWGKAPAGPLAGWLVGSGFMAYSTAFWWGAGLSAGVLLLLPCLRVRQPSGTAAA